MKTTSKVLILLSFSIIILCFAHILFAMFNIDFFIQNKYLDYINLLFFPMFITFGLTIILFKKQNQFEIKSSPYFKMLLRIGLLLFVFSAYFFISTFFEGKVFEKDGTFFQIYNHSSSKKIEFSVFKTKFRFQIITDFLKNIYFSYFILAINYMLLDHMKSNESDYEK